MGHSRVNVTVIRCHFSSIAFNDLLFCLDLCTLSSTFCLMYSGKLGKCEQGKQESLPKTHKLYDRCILSAASNGHLLIKWIAKALIRALNCVRLLK